MKALLIGLACIAALVSLIGVLLNLGVPNDGLAPSGERHPTTASEFKSYITLEHQSVQDCLQTILGNPPYQLSQGGFDDIRDWVADNITYVSDEERWGVSEYWQTPEETLSLRSGDCEDFATLLCTLLRAYGIPANQVYVAIGVDKTGNGHAFLLKNWPDGKWQVIEPRAGSDNFRRFNLADFKTKRGYTIVLCFNDVYYDDEPPYPGD